MKDRIFLIFVLAVTLLIQPNKAAYYTKSIILVDNNINITT